jgi:esterase/lipase superfamily enzyme
VLSAFLGGCEASSQLMPTPNLYSSGYVNPFLGVDPALQTNTVDVLYITDRIPLNDSADNRQYGYGRSRSAAFGVSRVQFGRNVSWDELVKASTSAVRTVDLAVTVPSTRELGRFQPTPRSLLATPDSEESRKSQEDQLATEAAFRKTMTEMLQHTRVKEVYLSVHGVNNQHTDSVSRIAQLWHFFGREGVPVAYSWPAGSPGIKAYMYDRESSEFTVYHLKQTLKLIASCPDVEKIHIIGHSRGTDVVSNALRELHIEYSAAGKSTRKELKLGTVILAAPDMDLQVTIQRSSTERLGLVPEQFAIYMGEKDTLLNISNWLFGGLARLGDVDATLFTADELKSLENIKAPQIIDCRITNAGSGGHDYFVSNPAVSSDLVLLVRYHLAPGSTFGRPLGVDDKSGFWFIDDHYPRTTPAPPTSSPAK